LVSGFLESLPPHRCELISQDPCGLANTDRFTQDRQLLDNRELQPSGTVARPVRRQIASADQVPDPLPGHLQVSCVRFGQAASNSATSNPAAPSTTSSAKASKQSSKAFPR
jgi:hypothetical protein